jgi:protein phosphatase
MADVCETNTYAGDIIIICTDGIVSEIEPEEMLDVVTNENAEQACHTLINRANERGGRDNATVVVVKILKNKRNRMAQFIRKGMFKKKRNHMAA